MGKTTNALEVVIKITLTSLQHCNPQFKKKKYHNQVLLDLFEDDTNAAFAAVKAQLLILTIF
jgi:aspartate kinase